MNKIIPALAATVLAGALALSGATVANALDSTPITPEVTSSSSTAAPTPQHSSELEDTSESASPSTVPPTASESSGPSLPDAHVLPTAASPASSSGASDSLAPTVTTITTKITEPKTVEVPVLILWDKPKDTFGPQHLNATLNTADLNALDSKTIAGNCYQADLYHPGETTSALIEGAILNAPNNPKEDLLPGGNGVAYKTWCVPAPTVQQCAAIVDGGTATDLNANGWTYTETRATGHNIYVAGGLHVYTEGSTSTDKAAGYRAVGVPLKLIGTPAIDLSVNSGGSPGLQLAVSLHGDGVWNGILVNEGNTYGAGNWWTSKAGFGVPAGGGYASLGTLDQYLAANPNATVLYGGYSLGSGVLGDVTIKSMTFGCKKYTFDVAPTPVIPTPVVTAVSSSTTDCGSKTVTTSTVTTTSKRFHLDGKTLIADKDLVVTTTASRPANDVECPVVVVPPIVPPISPPIVTAELPLSPVNAGQPLAFTGVDSTLLAGTVGGGALLLLLGAGLLLVRRRA